MISVIIPLYNKAATINRAIQSILNQSARDFEIIVVDDGSTDNGAAELGKATDSRIRYIRQDNAGVSAARNRGVIEAKGDWIAFLDADDEWEPEYLNKIFYLQNKYPDCNVCATAYLKINAAGKKDNIILRNLPSGSNDLVLYNYFEVAATSDPPIDTNSICVKKEALLSIGGFPDGIHQGEDLLTWAKLASNNKIAYCCDPLTIFHTGENASMEKPKRIPSDNDVVGKELEKLYTENPDLIGLKQYIAHWHKMRASIYLRLPKQSGKCRAEIRLSRQWHGNRKLALYTVLSCLPYPIRMKLLKMH